MARAAEGLIVCGEIHQLEECINIMHQVFCDGHGVQAAEVVGQPYVP
jgi:hypothetical protein